MMLYLTGCCVNIWIIVFVLKQAELLSTANNGAVILSLRLRSVSFSIQLAIKAVQDLAFVRCVTWTKLFILNLLEPTVPR